MEQQRNYAPINILAMLMSGLSVGWLMGMSVSTTAQTFLSAMIALLVSVISLLTGIKSLPDRIDYLRNVNLLPIGIFLLFVAFGSGVGVYARANTLLGRSPKELAATYSLDSTQQKEFLRALFFKHLNDSVRSKASLPFQYSASSSLCMAEGTELRMGLKNLDSSKDYQLLIENASDSTLIRIRNERCSQK